MIKLSSSVVVLLALGMRCAYALTVPHVFGDHMVLQSGEPVPVWGWAKPGETVRVRFAGQDKRATASGANGRWEVQLAALAVSTTPATMTITGAGTITFDDILVGEVWLCSGQSNMAKPVGEWRGQKPTLNYKEELRNANYPQIRMLQPRGARRPRPELDFDQQQREGEYPNNSNAWTAVTPTSLDQLKFSAAGYFFGRKLHQTLKVPVGIINSSSGGSRIEPWITPAGYASIASLSEFAKAVSTPGAKVEDSEVSTLFNGQIAPIAPFAIKGVLWYQGESNIYAGDGANYADKMMALINGWRSLWHRELPFYYVQVAPLLYHTTRMNLVVSPEAAPRFWEAQAACLQLLPRTGMVVTTDLVDDLTDIHPRNKKDVGERLARWALAKDYGHVEVEASGPTFKSVDFSAGKAILHFDHAAGGLVTRDQKPPNWFVIAGSDGVQYPGAATIEGDTVVVTSPRVPRPTVAHFAWDEAARPNLYNRAGLPAAPFRTNNPFTNNGPLVFRPGTRILFQGDSITDMARGRTADPNHILGHSYVFLIAAKYGSTMPQNNLVFINRGVGGNKIPDMAERWDKDTLELKPDFVSILIGINDAGHDVPIEESERKYDELLAKTVAALPNIKIVIGEPFTLPVGKRREDYAVWRAEVQKRQDLAAKMAAKYHAPLIHYQKLFEEASRRAPEDTWIWDGVHPTYSGHQLMADEWVRVVTEAWPN